VLKGVLTRKHHYQALDGSIDEPFPEHFGVDAFLLEPNVVQLWFFEEGFSPVLEIEESVPDDRD
jgi:hypothetical protein